ncbi:glycosyltransferase [Kitasatospora sp. NPDC101155]|uniref:glycosyltransferase n=1 Tax=Kitasatospora sp. NPDC101155 TaxID=3364097 RepID=UPI00380D178A
MAPLRVAIATESFLPEVNGVTNSVLRVLEHLDRAGHEALVIAPGPGADAYRGTRVVRVPSVRLPPVKSLPIGLPTRKVFTAIRDFRPDVVHLASPFVVGAAALTAARRLRLPTVAVFQTDLVGYLYPVDSVDGLRAAVLALADDDRRRRFGAAARRSVLHRTWPVLCDELLVHCAAVLRHEAVLVPGPRVSTRT